MTQPELYERFLALHHRPRGFVMPNAWDGVSALLLKEAGFEALGTSSAALASLLGRIDARHAVSREEHLENARLIGRMSGLPVNGDFEDGYGETPDDVARTVEAAIAAGLAGVGIEDTSGDPAKPIRDFDDSVARVAAAARVAKGRIVLTGRCDNFFYGRFDVADTIRRLTAYAEAGADVLFFPLPADMDELVAITRAVAPKPVNVVVGTRKGPVPVAELQKAGVKRISIGSALYARVMGDLRKAAGELASGDLVSAVATGLGMRAIQKMIGDASAG